jgi:uncharacterized protein (DUF433 family)
MVQVRSPMMNSDPSITAVNAVRALLSLREGVVLAGVPERNVRKDIESGWLKRRVVSEGNRLWFRWLDVYFLAGVYRNAMLTAELRKRAWERVETIDLSICKASSSANFGRRDTWAACFEGDWATHLEIDDYVFIDVRRVFQDLSPRMNLYAEGLKRIEEKSAVLGGKPVFRGTRLSVHHIGKMFGRGESLANIVDDYPYLTEHDVRFAHLYHLSHPTLGRPRASVEDPDDVDFELLAR